MASDDEDKPVSIAALRSRFENLSNKSDAGGPGRPPVGGPLRPGVRSRAVSSTSQSADSGLLNQDVGMRTERAAVTSEETLLKPSTFNKFKPPTLDIPTETPTTSSAPSSAGSTSNKPPIAPKPRPRITSTPASPNTSQPTGSLPPSTLTSPVEPPSESASNLPSISSPKPGRRAAPPPPPKTASGSQPGEPVVAPSAASVPAGRTPTPSDSNVAIEPSASVKALRDRFNASPATVSQVQERPSSGSSKVPKAFGMSRQLSTPSIKQISPEGSDEELHGSGEAASMGNTPPRLISRSASPVIPPPQPDRANKPRRSPSPQPPLHERSLLGQVSRDSEGIPRSASPVSLPARETSTDSSVGSSHHLSHQLSIASTSTTSSIDSVETSVPATPPRLPQRSRTNTLSKSEISSAAAPPLPARNASPLPSERVTHPPNRPHASTMPSQSGGRGRALPPPLPPEEYHPPPPPVRTALPAASASTPPRKDTGTPGDLSSEDEEEAGPEPLSAVNAQVKRAMDELPDSTHANRRAPTFVPDVHLHHPHHIYSFAVFGRFVCTGAHHVRVYDTQMSERPIFVVDLRETGLEFRIKDPRVTAMCFRPTNDHFDQGRYLICGTKDGHIWSLDIMTGEVTDSKSWIHGAAIVHIFRYKNWLLTLDEMGKLYTYLVPAEGDDPSKIPPQVRTLRVAEKFTFARMLGGQLWTATAPPTRSTTNAAISRGPTIRVYEPCTDGPVPPARTTYTTEWTGAVRSAATLPFHPDKVYLGHEGGCISAWSTEDLTCLQVLKVSNTDILSLEGVGGRLWSGNRKGQVNVYNVSEQPWQTTNIWTAHRDSPIYHIVFDPWSIEHSGRLTVYSSTMDAVRAWDGLLSVEWIDKQMTLRQPEYCTFRDIKVLICTWNIDSAKPTDLSGSEANARCFDQILSSVDTPDIIVFGFQEVIPLTDKKLTAKNLLFGGKTKEVGATHDRVSSAYRQWLEKLTHVVKVANPSSDYTKVQSESLVGLFTCMFVKSEQKEALRDMQICTIKRGIGGIYGNKGAILARMVVDDTSLCFINVHLAAGQAQKAARNADIGGIMEEKAVFPSAEEDEGLVFQHGGDGTAILDHEMVVLNGDLNYRIDQRRENVMNHIAANDLSFLLEHDQLNKEMRNNRAFRLRSFTEAPITFAPTYKYNPGTKEYDSSEKKRIPAWCDRILYTDCARMKSLSYRRYEPTVSDHRPVSAGLEMTIKKIDPEKMKVVRGDVAQKWAQREIEMLGKMADVFEKLW